MCRIGAVRRAAVLAVFAIALLARGAPGVQITILHTSDLHGRIHPVDALEDRDLGGGLARVATVVRQVRAEGNPVLLLDSGDTIQGSPEQALVFAGDPGAKDPIVAAMNLAGYDAMALGNHDFDFGRLRLAASQRQATFPMLSANALGTTGKPAFPPFVVKSVDGVRVGILGLVTSQAVNWLSPDLLLGLRFTDPVAVARRWVGELRGEQKCDVVVIVAHVGFEKDPKTGENRRGGGGDRAYALATEVPGVDLVLAGHAHAVVDPRRVGEVWVSEPGRWGEVLTRFDLTLEKTSSGAWRVEKTDGRNLPMRKVEPDPGIVKAVAETHGEAMKALAAPLTQLAATATTRQARAEDSGMVDWLHRVHLKKGGADLSFASVLAFEPLTWPAGPLTLRQVWQFYPYENSLVTVKATGKIVRGALERAASCLADSRERARDCDSLEGAEYELDLSRPAGTRVVFLRRAGREVADEETFTVALNSHRASGGGGYPMWKRAERLREKGNVRDMLASDARATRRLDLAPTKNWSLKR
jgi:2',3'-cyclic-nucleotide 2'-phosphodiesterase (5'-nucleotidase family)